MGSLSSLSRAVLLLAVDFIGEKEELTTQELFIFLPDGRPLGNEKTLSTVKRYSQGSTRHHIFLCESAPWPAVLS